MEQIKLDRWWQTALVALAIACLFFAPSYAKDATEKHAEFPAFSIQLAKGDDATAELLTPTIEAALKANREELKAGSIPLLPEKLALIEQEIIGQVLRSEGYYAATITHLTTAETIVYSLETGRRYHIRTLHYDIPPGIRNPDLAAIKLKTGAPLQAQAVLSAIEKLKIEVEKANCLFEVKVDYSATVFHETAEAEITLTVAESEQAVFGGLEIKGATTVREEYIANRMDFKEGACFKRFHIDKSRLNMLQSGLFATVDTTLEPDPASDKVRVHLQVSERKQRTITAGAGFSSDQGGGLTAGWEHRNFFGGAEKLQIDSKVSQQYNGVNGRVTLPDFLREGQALEIGSEVVNETPDAYDASRISVSGKISRKLSPKVKAYLGSEFKISEITDITGTETFALLSFPSGVEMDKRDSTLDPKKGFLASAEIQPFFNTLDTNVSFIKTTVAGSTYFTFNKAHLKPTLALRAAFGTMQGVDTDSIPADERYYSGGSGSVRGYGYQLLGPLRGNEPVGGRSLLEFSGETRLRFSESWGGVIFLDGGNTYDDYIPDYELLWAAGLGVRYYTDFAPIRFDIAIPLDRRDIDDSFQFYISIGQAF